MDEASRQEEDELAQRQGGRVYPVGQVLRSTYGAENHDTLGRDVTGLMLDLARVPYEPMGLDAADARPRHGGLIEPNIGSGGVPSALEQPCARDAGEGRGFALSLLGRVRAWWER